MWGADDCSGVRTICLPRSFDITVVHTVSGELLTALAAGELTLDAGSVTKLDAAGLQLLCAAAAAARKQGVTIRWKDVPAVLIDGARTLALTASIGLPSAATQERR
jgi:anti-anti-sigma regulatory factor